MINLTTMRRVRATILNQRLLFVAAFFAGLFVSIRWIRAQDVGPTLRSYDVLQTIRNGTPIGSPTNVSVQSYSVQDPAAPDRASDENGDVSDQDVEVLQRGPLHEAFAQVAQNRTGCLSGDSSAAT